MDAHWQYMSSKEGKALQRFACFIFSRIPFNEQRKIGPTALLFVSHLQERGLFNNLFATKLVVLAEAGLYFYTRVVDPDPHFWIRIQEGKNDPQI